MAMRYGYFDSEITGVDSEGMPIFDRAETSELFRLLFSKLLTNGVLAKPADCFKVLAGDTGLSLSLIHICTTPTIFTPRLCRPTAWIWRGIPSTGGSFERFFDRSLKRLSWSKSSATAR